MQGITGWASYEQKQLEQKSEDDYDSAQCCPGYERYNQREIIIPKGDMLLDPHLTVSSQGVTTHQASRTDPPLMPS